MVAEHALLHGEALLVVAAANAEDIAVELLAQGLALDLGADAVVVQRAELLLVVDLDPLLGARRRAGDVELHLRSAATSRTCVVNEQ